MGATLGSFPLVAPPNYYRATRHGERTGVAEEQKTLLYEDWRLQKSGQKCEFCERDCQRGM